MSRRDGAIELNVLGVSGNPKVLHAISKAVELIGQHVRTVQLGTDLSELPALLERVDSASKMLVFLEHPPVPDPELIQAAQQVYSKVPTATIWILSGEDPGSLPDELTAVGLIALLTPPFGVSLFEGRIRSAAARYG